MELVSEELDDVLVLNAVVVLLTTFVDLFQQLLCLLSRTIIVLVVFSISSFSLGLLECKKTKPIKTLEHIFI